MSAVLGLAALVAALLAQPVVPDASPAPEPPPAASAAPAPAASPPSLEGYWTGAFIANGRGLDATIAFQRDAAGRWTGRFDAPSQLVMEYPLDSVTAAGTDVAFALGDGALTFHARVSGDVLTGTMRTAGRAESFALRRTTPPSVPYTTIDVSFPSGNANIAGTILMPKTPGPHVAVLLVHGSGYETRWGTNYAIADRLARRGIAALVYDKRGTGDSSGSWQTATFQTLARDAVAAIALLRERPEIDPTKIGVWGNGQGACLAPQIAVEGDAAFVVAADGMAEPEYRQDLYRTKNFLIASGLGGDALREAYGLYAQFVDVARTGRGYDALAARLRADRLQPWLPLLAIPPRSSYVWSWAPAAIDYDSSTYWRRVRVPVFLIYGEDDRTVPVGASIDGIEALVGRNAHADVAAAIVPHADHARCTSIRKPEPSPGGTRRPNTRG
jgi:hypothetical protein